MIVRDAPLPATISGREAALHTWDAVVVGAGPAGALAAAELARRGAEVLLVEKSSFPRDKVCGCCVNGSALEALERAGLKGLPERLGAAKLTSWRLSSPGRTLRLGLPEGVALSRRALDTALVAAAIERGAMFLPETRAQALNIVGAVRTVQLQQSHGRFDARARLVIAADGLTGGATAARESANEKTQVAAGSRIGVGAVLETSIGTVEPGCVEMVCDRSGYIGLVRLEDGRLDLAAALDPAAVRAAGGPVRLLREILLRCDRPVPEGLESACVRGTAPLTRRPRRVAEQRLLRIGDAAGYVEPFTGEGIAWALWSALASSRLAASWLSSGRKDGDADTDELSRRWRREHKRLLGSKQLVCRLTALALRSPNTVRFGAGLLRVAPWLAQPLLRGLNSAPRSAGRLMDERERSTFWS